MSAAATKLCYREGMLCCARVDTSTLPLASSAGVEQLVLQLRHLHGIRLQHVVRFCIRLHPRILIHVRTHTSASSDCMRSHHPTTLDDRCDSTRTPCENAARSTCGGGLRARRQSAPIPMSNVFSNSTYEPPRLHEPSHRPSSDRVHILRAWCMIQHIMQYIKRAHEPQRP